MLTCIKESMIEQGLGPLKSVWDYKFTVVCGEKAVYLGSPSRIDRDDLSLRSEAGPSS